MSWTNLSDTIVAGNTGHVTTHNEVADNFSYLHRRMLNVYNVVDYGATGNGSTDDTTAISNALSAANTAGGGVVFFPAGNYKISSALTLFSNVALTGDGIGVSVITQSSTSANGMSGTDLQNVTLTRFTLQGPSSGTGKGIVLNLSVNGSLPYLNFESVYVTSFGSNGVDLQSPQTSVFTNVISVLNGNYGFYFHSATATTSCTFNSCYAISNTSYGYRIESMVYSSFNACAADHNQAGGYYLLDCQGINLSGCGVESKFGNGFTIDGTGGGGSFGVMISGCWVFNNAFIGIWVTGAARGVVLSACVENSVFGSPTNFILEDSGCSVFVQDPQNLTANTYNGAFVLIDGTPTITVSGGTMFVNAVQAFGGLDVTGAGNGLSVKEGSNCKQGTAALVSGSKVVSNTAVTANSRIFITSQVDGGTPGFLRVSTRTAGTSFTVTSSSGTDTSTFAYEIIEPG